MQNRPTAELVKHFLDGQQSAASELLERYGAMAYAVISHLLLYSRTDKDDVYQEACLRAFRDLRNLQDPDRFGGWFKQIAIRAAIDHIRQPHQRFEPLDDELIDHRPGPEALVEESISQHTVQHAISQLPEHYRQVIVLLYWSECSYQEIAAALRIPMGTVMSRLHKARSLLTKMLGADHRAEEEAGRWT